ncbi:hypothetical protein EDD18DRAFT_605993 [Armillaria luteobubalina]|uniref:Uncharacterized protein n=1 Tax=Armillaria luteobubalina TaxID=153913 RepID=A0AA39QH06_9AGAR|nr:hypothetical protein EDD18DRAFT_605993 [Armillaria luteobubalina]
MSSIVLPSRGQCIQITDNSQPCQCVWFFPPESPLLDQDICGLCGHDIHAHADYVSIVVNHCPVNRCAAYAQKTRLTQFCTCGAQICEHIATYNQYRLPEPWTVLDYWNPGNISPPSTTKISYSNDANSPFFLITTSSVYTAAISPGDSVTPAPVYSPSATSPSSAIQPDTTGSLRYNSDGYFYPNHSAHSPYAHPPEGGVTNESFEYQDFENGVYAASPEGRSGPYVA